MPRRYYAKSKKTTAKDQNFEQDNVGKEKERFQISIDLMSLKTLKDYDAFGRVGEFYFKIEGDKVLKSRFPDKGVIKLQKNQSFTSKADMNLWTQFETIRTNEENVLTIKVEMREQDHLKKDSVIAEQEFEIKMPEPTKYIILQDKDENTKAKLRIQSTRTRY